MSNNISEKIKITWLGHACFKIECGGHSLVMDPYRGVPGYPDLSVKAGELYASHTHHDDHGYFDAVQIVEEPGESPFSVKTVESFHDDQGGALRGQNKITLIDVLGKRIAHFGDLGHMLDKEQLAAVGHVDVALVPVGGTYTIDAKGAKKLTDDVDPVVVIPMHYRKGIYGYDVIDEPDEFISLCSEGEGAREFISKENSEFILDDSSKRRVVLLKFE